MQETIRFQLEGLTGFRASIVGNTIKGHTKIFNRQEVDQLNEIVDLHCADYELKRSGTGITIIITV